MYQQINFYRPEFIATKSRMGAGTLLAISGILVTAMIAAYLFATYEMMSIKSELKIVKNQERDAMTRLENFDPNAQAAEGAQSWSNRLEEAKRALRDQELVLTMVVDSSLGDIDGFSRYLTSLARTSTEGLWLSRIRLSALGDNTQIVGQALRPELIPVYLQSLAEEEPFANQRFYQFLIDRPQEQSGGAKQRSSDYVSFSLSSESTQFLADTGESQ